MSEIAVNYGAESGHHSTYTGIIYVVIVRFNFLYPRIHMAIKILDQFFLRPQFKILKEKNIELQLFCKRLLTYKTVLFQRLSPCI